MSGIYIHIPFCAKACHYCDFHFSTNQKNKSEMVEMICREIVLQRDYLPEKNISTVYFGGGTPSLLSRDELQRIMETLHKHFHIDPSVEITLEANPDDLSKSKLTDLKALGINRLSIGVQSFDSGQLRYMNRSHTAEQAEQAVLYSQEIGFDNISLDLIYGIPSPDDSIWEKDLAKAVALKVQHISSYCLTIEPATVFGKKKQKGLLPPENEEYNARQFEILMERMETSGFEQYEVSNFCKPGHLSKHNSSYWSGAYYLGVGPGAHSYQGETRQFNIENNSKYIGSLAKELVPFTVEILNKKTQANEYIMTRIRTKWGIDTALLADKFGIPFATYRDVIEKYLNLGFMACEKTNVKLTRKGLLFADKITEDLFVI